MKVLHLSDTHYDPEYLEGSNADCNEPLCCRATSGSAKSPDRRAGLWGDYRKCDTPSRTIHSMLQNIAYMHPVSGKSFHNENLSYEYIESKFFK